MSKLLNIKVLVTLALACLFIIAEVDYLNIVNCAFLVLPLRLFSTLFQICINSRTLWGGF